MPLRLLRDAIREHAATHPIERKCLVYLGDYIDRGSESRAVIELLVNDPLPRCCSDIPSANDTHFFSRHLHVLHNCSSKFRGL